MKKQDIIGALIIGEVSAAIFWWWSSFLGLSGPLITLLKFLSIISPAFVVLAIYLAQTVFKQTLAIYQASKTFFIGVLNTFIDLFILNILIAISGIAQGLMYTIFVVTSFTVATLNSYIWNKLWAFGKKETKAGGQEMIKFFVITTGGLLIHIIVTSSLVNIIGPQFGLGEKLWANVGKIAAAFLAFVWNFTGYKFIVFKK